MTLDPYEDHDQLLLRASIDAAAEVQQMNLPLTVELTLDSFNGLEGKFLASTRRVFPQFQKEHGPDLAYLVGISLRETWYAICRGSHYFKGCIEAGLMPDTDYTRSYTTPIGYGNQEGWAYSLYNELSKLVPAPAELAFRIGTPYPEPRMADVLRCMSLYFFSLGAEAMRNGRSHEGLDWIYEATDAEALCTSMLAWEEGGKLAKSAISLRGLDARHAENRAMKADVFLWCDSYLKPFPNQQFPSLDSAARALENLQPVVFRTLRAWVGEWMKQQSTGRQ